MFFWALPDDALKEDKEKLEEIYIKYRAMMFAYARRITDSDEDGEDAVHSAFVKIAKNIKKIGDVNSKETISFLIVIVKNSAYDMQRKAVR